MIFFGFELNSETTKTFHFPNLTDSNGTMMIIGVLSTPDKGYFFSFHLLEVLFPHTFTLKIAMELTSKISRLFNYFRVAALCS